jgi:hypothetical protein
LARLGDAVTTDEDRFHEFRLTEYETLANLVKSRDERVDRFVTVYLTLAGAPFALYAVLLKEISIAAASQPPVIIAWLWLFCGLFGIYLVQVIVQLRFSAILYVRAMNGLRMFFGGDKPVERGLWLPAKTSQPAYDESDHFVNDVKHPAKYMFHIIQAMAILNGIYVGLGLRYIPGPLEIPELARWVGPLIIAVIVWLAQVKTYRDSAKHRESRATTGGLI